MPRNQNLFPTYRLHKKSGRAIISVRNNLGVKQEILLPGKFGSLESRREYDRYLAIILANRGKIPSEKSDERELTITAIVLQFMEHAKEWYVNTMTKKPTTEFVCLRDAFRPLNRLYGPELASKFDGAKLESLQSALSTGSWLTEQERQLKTERNQPIGVARTTVNRHIDRIRRLFRWASVKRLVSTDVLVSIQAVRGLRAGRCSARETEAVRPVSLDHVEQTLPLLPSCPADILRLLLLTGARVGEMTRMRGIEIDRSGPVWIFSPAQHKGLHRGDVRKIAIGPRAQLILRRYLKDVPEAYVFVPAEQDLIRKAEMRAKRKSRVQPSQVSRARRGATRKPGAFYNHNSINHAIARACERAGLESWSCHQLRHAAALTILREFGLEAARSTLGHKQIDMTLHYSGIDLERAKEVASKMG